MGLTRAIPPCAVAMAGSQRRASGGRSSREEKAEDLFLQPGACFMSAELCEQQRGVDLDGSLNRTDQTVPAD